MTSTIQLSSTSSTLGGGLTSNLSHRHHHHPAGSSLYSNSNYSSSVTTSKNSSYRDGTTLGGSAGSGSHSSNSNTKSKTTNTSRNNTTITTNHTNNTTNTSTLSRGDSTKKSHKATNENTITNYRKVDEAFEKMKIQLTRFARANDRRMVLRTLKEVKYLSCLPVDNTSTVPTMALDELEQEISSDMYVLNGRTFFPCRKKSDENEASVSAHTTVGNLSPRNRMKNKKNDFNKADRKNYVKGTSFITILKELCYTLCEGRSLVPAELLYQSLLYKICRNLSSADAFKKLNEVLGSNDLVLIPITNAHKKKSKSVAAMPGQEPGLNLPTPIQVTLFSCDGHLHANITTELQFGIHRKSDLNSNGTGGRPWIKCVALLQERTNFSNGSTVRHVTTSWPDMYV